jgi:hypothetical protein
MLLFIFVAVYFCILLPTILRQHVKSFLFILHAVHCINMHIIICNNTLSFIFVALYFGFYCLQFRDSMWKAFSSIYTLSIVSICTLSYVITRYRLFLLHYILVFLLPTISRQHMKAFSSVYTQSIVSSYCCSPPCLSTRSNWKWHADSAFLIQLNATNFYVSFIFYIISCLQITKGPVQLSHVVFPSCGLGGQNTRWFWQVYPATASFWEAILVIPYGYQVWCVPTIFSHICYCTVLTQSLRKGAHSNPSLSFIILTVLSSASYFDNIILIVFVSTALHFKSFCQQHVISGSLFHMQHVTVFDKLCQQHICLTVVSTAYFWQSVSTAYMYYCDSFVNSIHTVLLWRFVPIEYYFTVLGEQHIS